MIYKCPICKEEHDYNKLLKCDILFSQTITNYLNMFLEKEYMCFNCNKKLSSKQNLEKHTMCGVCKKSTEFKCNGCNKKFSTKQKLNYHITKNVCKTLIMLPTTTTNLNSKTHYKSSHNIKKNINNGNINNGNINNGNINNVVINVGSTQELQQVVELLPFRDASYKISTKKYLEYANNPEKAIKQFVKDNHFNPSKPERMNILNTNRRDNRIQLFDLDDDFICRWQTQDKTKVLELLCDRGVNALFFAKTMLDAAGIKLDPKKEIELNAKIKEYETSDKVKKKYIDMIGDLSYDYRNMVEINKKKSCGLIKS